MQKRGKLFFHWISVCVINGSVGFEVQRKVFISLQGTPVNRIPIMAKHVLDLCK